MRKLHRLWPALETRFSVTGVRAQLAWMLREEIGFVEPFLRRLPDPSETYLCEQPGGNGCPRRVVTHPDGRIVAVCGCDPQECETLDLGPTDIIGYQLDPKLLCKFLGRSLGFAASPSKLAGRHDIWNTGFFTAAGTTRLPVFLVLPASRHELRSAIDHLLAEYDGPFIVLLPTSRFVDASLEERLRRRQAKLAVLEDALVAEDGKLAASQTLAALIGAEPAPVPQPATPTGRLRVPRSAGSPQAVAAVLAFMEQHGLGITQFATQVDTTDRTVRNFLKSGKMRRSSFETMAARMGLTTDQLLRGEIPKKTR